MIKHPLLWIISLIGKMISMVSSAVFLSLVFLTILSFNIIDEVVDTIEATDTRGRRMYRKMFRRRNE